jgi:archaeal cell division control protein 6
LIKNRQTLSIDYVPDKLPFRDQESRALATILSTVVRGSRPSNLLVYGPTGTGKTAVVRKVVETLAKKVGGGSISIQIPIINAKLANSSYKLLFEMAEQLGINREEGKQVHFTGLSMGEAITRILNFTKRKKLHVILVIDEIDALADKNGNDILYSFTRANETMTGGFITLIGISNKPDFKKYLDPRVVSSLSDEEVSFGPYTVDQLRQILSERAKLAFNPETIAPSAINLCAALAGREHGDARRAIDLLRVAAELAERQSATKVEERHVRAAQEKLEKDINVEILKNSPLHFKLVLLSISRSKNGNTGDVYDNYVSLCKQTEQEPLTQRRTTQIISELDLQGLISRDIVNQGRYGRTQKISMAIPAQTIKAALKDDAVLSGFIEL